MSFEQEFIHGYKEHSKDFDKWCNKANSVLGNITQCGILEFDSTGHALFIANRPDYGEQYIDKKGYIFDNKVHYSEHLIEGITTFNSNEGLKLMHNNEESMFGKKFDLWHGFSFAEKIEKDINRHYFFASDTPEVYDKLFNNVNLVKKFIKYFKQENQHIINYFRERKLDIANKKDKFFINNSDHPCLSRREKAISILRTLGLLDKDTNITEKEWQCLQLFSKGLSASKTGKILGRSRRTVETHFEHLKNKLQVNSKSELMEIINCPFYIDKGNILCRSYKTL